MLIDPNERGISVLPCVLIGYHIIISCFIFPQNHFIQHWFNLSPKLYHICTCYSPVKKTQIWMDWMTCYIYKWMFPCWIQRLSLEYNLCLSLTTNSMWVLPVHKEIIDTLTCLMFVLSEQHTSFVLNLDWENTLVYVHISVFTVLHNLQSKSSCNCSGKGYSSYETK